MGNLLVLIHSRFHLLLKLFLILICTLSFSQTASAESQELAFWDALSKGKFDFSARYRYEHVDDDAASKNANASTIRTSLGYNSGTYHGFALRILAQDVRDVFVDDFNDATGRPNSKTEFAVVADPSATDLLESYISYSGDESSAFKGNTIKVGRQIITYRKAPFHRFMGTVLWRQNWQNHDALSFENTSLPDTTIRYAYSWNVNRIFSDHAVTSAKSNFDSNSHFINIQNLTFKYANLEGYAYLLDFENAASSSTATYGARMNGAIAAGKNMKVIYAGEYASQDDYANNPGNVNENYYLAELGMKLAPSKLIKSLLIKFDYEVLTGNGRNSFLTPLATGHAFQGWNDRFLVTPVDGIEDAYITAVMSVKGFKFIASYHMLESNNLSYDYGNEIDLLLIKTFKKHYTFGAKIGIYDADSNINNLSRGGNRAADVVKTWVWAQLRF
jgi:hypothetical protein